MRWTAALGLLFAACACATQLPQPTVPVLLRFPPPERGGPTVFPEASPSGRLDLSGPCARIEIRPGDAETLISSADADIARDSKGTYLQYRDRRFRHGAWVKGAGGHFPGLPSQPLDGTVPETCRAGPFLVLVDIHPFDPAKVPPPQSPPPPVR
jgi:hypothetical protein